MCRKNHLTAGKITMVGFGIPSVLALVWLWPLSPGSGFSSGMSYHGTYRRMIDDGVPTFWGWVGFVEALVIFGLHGAVGAIIFFLVWRKVERGSYAP
jgi:hypothetical protein